MSPSSGMRVDYWPNLVYWFFFTLINSYGHFKGGTVIVFSCNRLRYEEH